MTKCLKCNKELKNDRALRAHLGNDPFCKTTTEDYYLSFFGNKNKCKNCNNYTNFKSLKEGYHTFCSISCMNKSDDHKIKSKETIKERYGVEYISQSKEIRTKIENTMIQKYGAKTPLESEVLSKKIKSTMLSKYGSTNPSTSKELYEKKLKIFYDKVLKKSKDIKPKFKFSEYKGVIDYKFKFECKKCNTEFTSYLNFGNIPRCLKCNPTSTSILQKEIYDFCCLYAKDTLLNDKTIIKPLELDIYIPSKKFAIEFNGLYWHSESKGKDSKYHLNKFNKCKSQDITLFQIFEDEWINKKDIVKSMILNKLGNNSTKYDARKCTIKNVDKKTTKEFLDKNHLQGSVNSSISIGLYFKDELVSLLTLGKPRYNKNYDYEILRFCNKLNTNTRGGFSKLLNHFIKTYNTKSIITYADKRYSNGTVYSKNNFKLINESKSNYFYVKQDKRYSRIKFQKHKLEKQLDNFDSLLSEKDNMLLNGYDRIWDCGNLVFEYV